MIDNPIHNGILRDEGDDHRGQTQGQPDEKQRQEPADPFLPRDLEDARGGHEIALRGDEDVGLSAISTATRTDKYFLSASISTYGQPAKCHLFADFIYPQSNASRFASQQTPSFLKADLLQHHLMPWVGTQKIKFGINVQIDQVAISLFVCRPRPFRF